MFDIQNTSIQQIHNSYKNNQLTVRTLVLSYLSKIAKVDKGEQGLNSILEINPDVLFIADELDEKMKNIDEFTPLFGIPVLLKDNINTADKLHTSAGSLALSDNYASYDAHVVKCLRKAGAIVLGKANMTEFANFITDGEMPDGYSSRGGQVINPYNKAKTPSGSSSGSAVAVAAGLCTVSVGTETAGSIITPSGQNGIVGIKPTIGLVGRSGIIPISNTFDTAGSMTKNVRDAAILLTVISGTDPNDISTHSNNSRFIDYTQYLDKDGLKGLRIGICRNKDNREDQKSVFNNLLNIIFNAGAILIDDINLDFEFNMWKINKNEFEASMNYYLSTLSSRVKTKTLKDIIDYNETNSSEAIKYGQKTFYYVINESTGTLTEPEYIEELINREKIISEFDGLFIKNEIDVILCETGSVFAPYTGFPCMTIPIGQRADKLPIDSYWIARRFNEATLFKATYAVEQLINVSLIPEFD